MSDPNEETQEMPQASVSIEYLLSVLISEVQALIHELRILNRQTQQQQIKTRQRMFIGTPTNDT